MSLRESPNSTALSPKLIFGSLIWLILSCHHPATDNSRATRTDSLAIRRGLTETPPLAADSAIAKMHIEPGFTVKLVASEPLVAAPIALTFDDRGRIWVVEMMDYMPDTAGTGEDLPTGKVVILTDKNGDGVMDSSQVFLDSLVLPRAICLVEDGILVAEPPKLWFYRIKNDRPADRTLVDSAYAAGGNVEHQPNGLYRALDNWIYNAKSSRRYRRVGHRWLIENTHFRGQWGLSQDNSGRLYYNTNSDNLIGDYFPPGLGATNVHQREVAGFSTNIVEDNRVYPIRPTPGVNRGYMPGILDDSLRLVNFTAACGPLIYNGNLFDKSYEGNAFVAEPSANLIKRDLLTEKGYITTGKEAYVKKEFLASEDERFRPVNLHNGPDGALYIVDMYRGIIQHKTYLTPYLKSEITSRSLSTPLNCGRIYKVVPQNAAAASTPFGNNPIGWIKLLQHPNGWVRSKAQQLLVDARDRQTVPALRQLLQDTTSVLPLIHALWTLEGLNALQPSDLLPLLQEHDWAIRMQALTVLPAVLNRNNYRLFIPALKALLGSNDTLAAPYLGFLAHAIQPLDPAFAHSILLTLTRNYANNRYVADAIISNLYNKEDAFYQEALTIDPDTSTVFNHRLKSVINDIAKAKNNSNLTQLAKEYPKGATLFRTVCQTCHGADGNGINSLAPPLNGSNWVQGDKNQLIPIVLYGLTGPVRVAGHLYKSPEINGDMPGIGSNASLSDEDIAQVLSFIRNAWNNKAPKIEATDITNTRKKFNSRQKTFTMPELDQLK